VTRRLASSLSQLPCEQCLKTGWSTIYPSY